MSNGIDTGILNDTKDTFLISNIPNALFSNHRELKSGLFVNYSGSTEELFYSDGTDEICILGICVDSQGLVERAHAAEFIVEHKGGIEETYYLTGRFAGKYVIIYFREGKLYVWGDAISSIPIYYGKNKEDGICISNTDG